MKKHFISSSYNFEAIHNKDYSVVKTFRAAFGSLLFFSLYLERLFHFLP